MGTILPSTFSGIENYWLNTSRWERLPAGVQESLLHAQREKWSASSVLGLLGELLEIVVSRSSTSTESSVESDQRPSSAEELSKTEDPNRPMRDNDPVNHPEHYTSHPSGIETIQVTEWFNFNRGNAIKYIWRADGKGDTVEDLKKARWYLDREIARVSSIRPR